jgi:hypothetical protein
MRLAAVFAGLLGAVLGYAVVGFGLGGGCGYFDGGPEPDQEWFCEGEPLDFAFVLAIGLPVALAIAGAVRRSWFLIVACLLPPVAVVVVGVALLN